MADEIPVQEAVEETPVETSEVKEPSEETKSPEQTKDEIAEAAQALNLFKLLKNPTSAKAIIRTLAEEHGIVLTGKETPKQEDRKVRSIKGLVKEKLGDEYAFIADKLGDVFEEALATERESLNEKFNEINAKSAEKEAEAAFEWLQNEHEDANNYEQVIVTLMEEVPPGNMSAKKYLETLYIIAKGREGKAASSKKLAQKITRNSTDPDVKLSGKTRSSDVPVKSTKGMSIDDALSEAIASIKI
jgi:hypothetical protein